MNGEKITGVRLGGSGGQGVILCSVILARAALAAGHYAAQSQSYGPEARGGSCKAETVISDAPIDYPKVGKSDVFLALTQSAMEKYLPQCAPGSLLILDESLTPPEGTDLRIRSYPILSTAAETLGKPMTANIVAAGILGKTLALFSDEALERAVRSSVPKGTEELNLRALKLGFELAEG